MIYITAAAILYISHLSLAHIALVSLAFFFKYISSSPKYVLGPK
jgi:hypothetical protein